MEPYYANIEHETIKNNDYRRVIYTVPGNFQLVLMSIPVGENIHMEKHPTTTQFIRVEKGLGVAIIPDMEHQYALSDGTCVVIPPNTFHKIENVGDEILQLYTIYTPPEHKVDLVQHSNPDNTILGVNKTFTLREINDLVKKTKDITYCDVTRDEIINILFPDDELDDELLAEEWSGTGLFADFCVLKITEKLTKNGVCFVHLSNSSGEDRTLLHVFSLFKTNTGDVYRIESYGMTELTKKKKKRVVGTSYCTRSVKFNDYKETLFELISMKPGQGRVKLWNKIFSTTWDLDIDTDFEMDVILQDVIRNESSESRNSSDSDEY